MDPLQEERSTTSQRGSRGRGGYRGRGQRNRPQNPRNREQSDGNNSVQNPIPDDTNNDSTETNNNRQQHQRRNRGHHNDSGGNEESNSGQNERYNNREQQQSSSNSRGRRGATSFSTTVRSNVQSTRGRGQRKKPDFLILHGEKTTFLKSMKNSHQSQAEPIIEDENEEDKNEIKCPFCTLATPRLSGVKLQAITNCSHIMCFECALRWYFLSSHSTCPFCRQDLSKIIITNRLNADHSNVQELMYEYTYNTKLLSKLRQDTFESNQSESNDQSQIESLIYIDGAKGTVPLPRSIQDIVNSVLNFECKICIKRNVKNVFRLNVGYKTTECLELINNHLRNEHRSTLCELCFINLDSFASEYQIFNENELQLHRKYGTKTTDKSAMVGPHPCCHLCDPVPTYYYNLDALEVHCRSIHCSCYVCSQTIFFRDPDSLRRHVEQNHLLCTVCVEQTNQVLGFGSVAEYKRHIEQEHPNTELDLDSLSTRVRQPIIDFDPFRDYQDDDVDGEMTDRMANDQIDNLLRQSFQANQHEFFNASNVENYVTNFPSIEGMPNGERLLPTTQNVHVFPGRSFGNRIGGRQNYEQDFPEMGPSTSSTQPALGGISMASVAGVGGRRNAYNISRSLTGRTQPRKVDFKPRPLTQVGIDGQQTQPTETWQGKKPKATKNSAKALLLEDFVEPTNGGTAQDEPLRVMKPPSVSLIERVESRPNPLQNPQRPPKTEDFPSLAGPSTLASNHTKKNRNGATQSSLSGWSKVTAPEPEVKDNKKGKQQKNKQQQQQQLNKPTTGLEKKVEKLNLTDSSLFPALDIPEVSALENIPSKKPAKRLVIPKKAYKR